MCKNHDSNGNTDSNVPYTRIRLSDFAELQETLDRLHDSLEAATKKATAFAVGLQTISNLCPDTDSARAYIGKIARDTLNPLVAKAGEVK